MKLEKNFSLHEFRCKDGTDVPEEFMCHVQQLCMNLQVLRDHIGKPITIISGYRSPEYNKKIKGAKRSQHLLAKAADIVVPGMTSLEVRDIIIQLIKEERWTRAVWVFILHLYIMTFAEEMPDGAHIKNNQTI